MEPMGFDFGLGNGSYLTEASSEEMVMELFDVLESCPPAARERASDAALEAVALAAPEAAAPVVAKKPRASGRRAPKAKAAAAKAAAAAAAAKPPAKSRLRAGDEASQSSGAASEDLGGVGGSGVCGGGEEEEEGATTGDHARDMTAFLRPSSAYDRYRDALRETVSREHPHLSRLALNEQLRLNWQALDEASKAPYVAAAQRERQAFAKLQAKIKFGDEFPWEAERPRRPLTVYDLWSRDVRPRDRVPPGTKESVVRKRITAMYQGLTEDERRPYEDEYAKTNASFLEEEARWAAKWDLVKVYKGYVPRTDPAAVAQAARKKKEEKSKGTESAELEALESADGGRSANAAEERADDDPKAAGAASPKEAAEEEDRRPCKPMSSYNTWRRTRIDEFRDRFPDLPHSKLERKLLAAFKGLPKDERQPLEDAYRAKADQWKADVAAWDARKAKEAEDDERRRAEKRSRDRHDHDDASSSAGGGGGPRGGGGDDDGASDDGSEASTPPAPTSYPKAPDMWARDLKEDYRSMYPDLSPPELIRKMKAVWSATAEDDPVKKESEAGRDERAKLANFNPLLSRSFSIRFGWLLDERSSLGTVSKRRRLSWSAHARNGHVEATSNHPCPSQVPRPLRAPQAPVRQALRAVEPEALRGAQEEAPHRGAPVLRPRRDRRLAPRDDHGRRLEPQQGRPLLRGPANPPRRPQAARADPP